MKRSILLFVLLLSFSVYADTGFMDDYLMMIERIEEKYMKLAETIPAENYNWRPDEGVRSISEVMVHVGAANYFFMSFVGYDMPEGGQDLEKNITGKEDVLKFMKESFATFKDRLKEMKNADLSEEVTFFDNTVSKRAFLTMGLGHMHEHLGQAIAYARSNKISPPWSEG